MSKYLKIIELIFLGIVFPSAILFFNLSKYVLIYLWVIFIYATFIYILVYYKKKDLTHFFDVKIRLYYKYYIILLIRWIFFSILLFFFTLFIFPEKLFIIQKNNEQLIYKIFLFYPLLSAFPQEFIFCTFFFNRYKNLFHTKREMIVMSALIFCLAHIYFINLVAPLLSLFGGFLFAYTYNKTKSLFITTIEHSLYGNTLFFIGLGWFFWGGSVT